MSTKNLDTPQARERLKDMIDEIKVAMMITGFGNKPLDVVPMMTKQVDKQGRIWFLSGRSSQHNKDLEQQSDIQLVYSKPSDMAFLSVYGSAQITTDKDRLHELYSATTDNWFEGPDDPQLTAICVSPQQAYYWDSKTNKYLSLAKLGLGALTGGGQDIGKKGNMKL